MKKIEYPVSGKRGDNHPEVPFKSCQRSSIRNAPATRDSIVRVVDGQARMVTDWSGKPDIGDGRPANEVYIPGSLELSSMATDETGNLHLVDVRNSRIRRIGTDGTITTIAGSTPFRFAGDGGPAAQALLGSPVLLASSPDGSIHVFERDDCRARTIAPDGVIRTVAGDGICGMSGADGPTATQVAIGNTTAMAADWRGNIYVADGRSVRVIEPGGQIRAIVNRNRQPGSFDDFSGPAVDAAVNGPIFGLYVDNEENLYLADSSSNRVRKVIRDGQISTFAGSGPPGPPVFAGDGGPATEARLAQPSTITGDPEGNIYIFDTGNARIRKVTKDGLITTVAGAGRFGFAGDGGLLCKPL